MTDLISRSAALEDVYEMDISDCTDIEDIIDKAYATIAAAPTVDAVPVVHARWIGQEFDGYADGFPVFDTWSCSKCGEEFRSEGEPPAFNFCPNCGARMDGEAE